jgi:hypothetical protein
MSNVPACPKFARLAPIPYTFSGNLLLRPVDDCGVDLLWIGDGDLQLAQCAALQALIDYAWFRSKLVPGNPTPPAYPIE